MKKTCFILRQILVLSLLCLACPTQSFAKESCPQGLEAFTQGLHKKLRKDCAYCHGGQGPGPSHSVEDPQQSYKMIKALLNLSNPLKLDGLSESKFITTGGDNHCASYGVECKTSSKELMNLVKPWIEVEMKFCQKAPGKFIETAPVSVFQNEKMSLSVPGYDGVVVQMSLESHAASDLGSGYVKLSSLKVCHPSKRVKIKELKVLVDGQSDAYAQLADMTFEPCQEELKPKSLLFAAKNKKITRESQVKIALKKIELGVEKTLLHCQYSNYYNQLIVPRLSVSCKECHTEKKNPLTCDGLLNQYSTAGFESWKRYLYSGQSHPKLYESQNTKLLLKYLELETEKEYEKLKEFKSSFDILFSKVKTDGSYIKVYAHAGRVCVQNKITKNISCFGNIFPYYHQEVHSFFLLSGNALCILQNNGEFICRGESAEAVIDMSSLQTIVSGNGHHCVLVASKLRCWGDNTMNQSGYTDAWYERISSVYGFHNKNFISFGKSNYLNLPSIKQVVAGANHTCALFYNGRAKCWGDNQYGQAGSWAIFNRNVDINDAQYLPLPSIKYLFAKYNSTCAVFIDRRAKCWGRHLNKDGFLSPSFLKDAEDLSLSGIEKIYIGDGHNCLVQTNGNVKCWGKNNAGQLGYGDFNYISNISFRNLNIKNVESMSLDHENTCAVTKEGLKCWGRNRGALGYRDHRNRTKPEDFVPFYPLLEVFNEGQN